MADSSQRVGRRGGADVPLGEPVSQARLEAIRARWPLSAVVGRYVTLRKRGREHAGLCPFHKEKNPSFGVVDERGFYHCFGCGAHGDVVSFVMLIEAIGFREAVERLEDGAAPAPRFSAVAAPRGAAVDEHERVRRAERVWDGVQPIAGTLAERYLRHYRGIDIPLPASLGFHPRCEYWEEGARPDDPPVLRGRYPALVALVETVAGEFCGVWRIYLNVDGDKAAVPLQKRGLGVTRGGAVRLGAARDEMGIGEGIESTLAAAELCQGLLPFWSALSTSGIRSLELPEHVRHPIVFADQDQAQREPDGSYRRRDGHLVCAGEDAAQAACARWRAEGRSPDIQLPPLKDFGLVLLARKGRFAVDL